MIKQSDIDALLSAMLAEEGIEEGKLLLESTFSEADLADLKVLSSKLEDMAPDSELIVSLKEKLLGMSEGQLKLIEESNILLLSDMARQITTDRTSKKFIAESITPKID